MKAPTYDQQKTKYEGWYKWGHTPERLALHNLQSWRIIEAIMAAYGKAYF